VAGKGGERRGERLLVADVRQNGIEARETSGVGRDDGHSAARHEDRQSERLQRQRLPARVRS